MMIWQMVNQHSSQKMHLSARSVLLALGLLVIAGLAGANTVKAATPVDLDIAYIERTPRYNRYCLTYPNNVPTLCAGTANQKRWPTAGEQVTYTAHVRRGPNGSVSKMTYQWLVNGTQMNNTTTTAPAANGEVTLTYKRPWKITDTIQLKVSPVSATDNLTQNNSLSLNNSDMSLTIFAEQGIYSRFQATANMVGTSSFYDWIQAHFAKMNQMMAAAKYPTSPNGITTRVRIDKVIIANELDASTSPLNNDPLAYFNDGKWQFVDGDTTNAYGNNGWYQQYVNQFATNYDYGLIHELSHQLGMIDMYRFNIKNDPTNNNGVQVLDNNGRLVDSNALPPVFTSPGLMGGGNTAPYNSEIAYDSHQAAAMNTNAGYRRGFYGEFLFDIPTTNKIKITNVFGQPLALTQVNLYQRNASDDTYDNTPEISGTTDANGMLTLPNRSVTTVTTATGHSLKANPWGQVNVVGTNGTFLVKVTSGQSQDWRWLTLADANLAYWAGNKTTATYSIATNIDPRSFGTNIALNKQASSNRSINGGHEAGKAVDGDTTTAENNWQVDNPLLPGDWWQVDLGQTTNIGKVLVYPNSQNYADWCDSYHISVSTTGAFAGEQTTIFTETNSPHNQVITDAFTTVTARFVRIICDNEQSWVQLQEVEVLPVLW